jgi:hypothetical protein
MEMTIMRVVRSVEVCLLIAMLGCHEKGSASKHPRSERERDSILGQSRLPGAQGVRGALRESDAAKARNAQLDSVANEP